MMLRVVLCSVMAFNLLFSSTAFAGRLCKPECLVKTSKDVKLPNTKSEKKEMKSEKKEERKIK